MEGFGPMFILVGCFILLNTFGKIKRNKAKFASSYKNLDPRRGRNKSNNTGKYRNARNK